MALFFSYVVGGSFIKVDTFYSVVFVSYNNKIGVRVQDMMHFLKPQTILTCKLVNTKIGTLHLVKIPSFWYELDLKFVKMIKIV